MSPFQSSGSSFFLDPLKEAVQDLCGCSVFRSVLKASADVFCIRFIPILKFLSSLSDLNSSGLQTVSWQGVFYKR